MRLERQISFCLRAEDPAEARSLLAAPERALARLAVFRDLKLMDGVLSGALAAPFALIGEVRFPFRSRFELDGDSARLEPEPLADRGDAVAELGGSARAKGDRVCYQAQVALELRLPEGDKWGGRAFRKMAEAAFEKTLKRTLGEISS